jgi:hypothetical protein
VASLGTIGQGDDGSSASSWAAGRALLTIDDPDLLPPRAHRTSVHPLEYRPATPCYLVWASTTQTTMRCASNVSLARAGTRLWRRPAQTCSSQLRMIRSVPASTAPSVVPSTFWFSTGSHRRNPRVARAEAPPARGVRSFVRPTVVNVSHRANCRQSPVSIREGQCLECREVQSGGPNTEGRPSELY